MSKRTGTILIVVGMTICGIFVFFIGKPKGLPIIQQEVFAFPWQVPAGLNCISYVDRNGGESICQVLRGNIIPAFVAQNQCVKLSADFQPKNCFIVYQKVLDNPK